jgi:hypothetical protein
MSGLVVLHWNSAPSTVVLLGQENDRRSSVNSQVKVIVMKVLRRFDNLVVMLGLGRKESLFVPVVLVRMPIEVDKLV